MGTSVINHEGHKVVFKMLEEWTIERSAPEQVLTAGNTYQLKNLYHDRYVVHGKRDYGINLVWRDKSFRDVFFRNPGSQSQPIRYDEAIAIAVAGGGYLHYKKRDWGINPVTLLVVQVS